jgi:hypothetical protein
VSRLLAEYAEPDQLLDAIDGLRTEGYEEIEAYTPYPVHGIDRVLGARRSRLPIAVFVLGLSGAGAAYALQWLLNAYLYPLNVGGRPPHFPLSFVPITFEMGVLAAALTASFGVVWLGSLFRPWHPVFEAPGIESATLDHFWLEVVTGDPDETRRLLERGGALRVVAALEEGA